jgi:biopolymer transport protein TolR
MAHVNARGRQRRRSMNEINMVPFIDVMLVLLIIFMVSAPLITTGVVDLPSVGAAHGTPAHWIEVAVSPRGGYVLKLDGARRAQAGRSDLGAAVAQLQQEAGGGLAAASSVPVVISAPKEVRYDEVMQAMDVLQRSHVDRVGLLVQTTAR